MTASDDKHPSKIRYVELYAGIGGWRQALENVTETLALPLHCVAALDHSDVCRSVYQHNWPFDDFEIRPIEAVVTEEKWQHWKADVVVLSPPCQPHTRQHDNQSADLVDPRSRSFLHLCQLLEKGIHLPAVLILENVVGFEASQSLRRWLKAALPQYRVAQFHLDPTQIAIPNERPRYYCVAVRNDRFQSQIRRKTEKGDNDNWDWIDKYFSPVQESVLSSGKELLLHTSISELGVMPTPVPEASVPMINTILLEGCCTKQGELHLTKESLEKPSSWCLDVVGENSRRTSCFTSSYGKYFKGTGSVLAYKTSNGPDIPISLQSPEERSFNPNWFEDMLQQGYVLRYFSGDELVRLFGFRQDFKFPSETTTKQRWKLIGNSLNVGVASKVVELGLLASGLALGKKTDTRRMAGRLGS